VAILALPGLAVLATAIIGSVLLRRWAVRVAARRNSPIWRGLAWLPYVGLALNGAAAVASVVLLVRSFSEAAAAAPAAQSRIVSDGIAQAMNCGALVALPAGAVYLTTIVSSLAGSVLPPRPSP
jgi:hypothetical protein